MAFSFFLSFFSFLFFRHLLLIWVAQWTPEADVRHQDYTIAELRRVRALTRGVCGAVCVCLCVCVCVCVPA